MANDIKPLNLNSDTASSPQPDQVKPEAAPVDKATPVVTPKQETPLTAEPSKVVQRDRVDQPTKDSSKKKAISVMLVLIVLGALSGFGLSRRGPKVDAPKKFKSSAEEGIEVGDTFGVQDENSFRDEVEGELTSGGVDGEGSHHLVREGGESQNVYLTSSVIDLDQFVDKKVKVWGETFEAQQAGWLMDVGRLQILE